jgi:hypothetical protein
MLLAVPFLLNTSIATHFLALPHATNKNSEKKTMKYKIGKISIVRTRKIQCNFRQSMKLGKCKIYYSVTFDQDLPKSVKKGGGGEREREKGGVSLCVCVHAHVHSSIILGMLQCFHN